MNRLCRAKNHDVHGARKLHDATYYPVRGGDVKEYWPVAGKAGQQEGFPFRFYGKTAKMVPDDGISAWIA
jgi:hypothetical protein